MRYSDVERRLQRLEAQRGEDDGSAFELWVDDGDGWLLGPNGERMLADEVAELGLWVIDIGGEPSA